MVVNRDLLFYCKKKAEKSKSKSNKYYNKKKGSLQIDHSKWWVVITLVIKFHSSQIHLFLIMNENI